MEVTELKLDIVPFAERVCQKRLGVQHVIVMKDDEVHAKFDFEPTDRRSEIHSATKSVVSIAVGIAIGERLFDLDTRPAEVLKKYLPEEYDKTWDSVTVRDLLTMRSGHDHKLMDGYSLEPGVENRDDLENQEWVNYIFSQPLQVKPGTQFVYNNACPHLLSRMIAEISGQNLIDWLKKRLFEPLEIHNPQWGTDPLGYTCGPGGLQLTTEEYARITQLCLHKGKWHGKQLVPEAYMEAALGKQTETAADSASAGTGDLTSGYGYFFWKARRNQASFLYGWAGQLGIILPGQHATVTMKSYEFDIQALMDAVWDTIVPQLKQEN